MFAYQLVAARRRARQLVQIAEAHERDEQITASCKFDAGVPRLYKKCNNEVMHMRFPGLAQMKFIKWAYLVRWPRKWQQWLKMSKST